MNATELMEEVIDICSSGLGGGLDEFHITELKRVFRRAKLTKEQKLDFFVNTFVPGCFGSCGWMIEDLSVIRNCLQLEQQTVTITV